MSSPARASEIELQTRLRTILFVQQMHMRGCHAFCVRMHQRQPYGKEEDL